jgi:hypothetical protein
MKRLVINGCSYADIYARGGGHVALAKQLNIEQTKSLTISGACNTRILRTTLKDSYCNLTPTLYVIGLSFLSRSELPIASPDHSRGEGRWLSIINHAPDNVEYDQGWNTKLVEQFIDIRLKYQVYSVVDRLEDLMYRVLSFINDLKSRGHQVVVFKQANDVYDTYLTDPQVDLLTKSVNIIDGLRWCANNWQYERGVTSSPMDAHLPYNLRHPAIGQYQVLNDFLLNYINNNKLL